MQTNFTQVAGLLAFLPAALSGAIAARQADAGRASVWLTLAAFNAAFVAEIVLGLRHSSTITVGAWLQQAGLYGDRRPAQAALIFILTPFAFVALVAALRAATTQWQAIAIGATFAAFSLFLVEAISLHAIDAVLYRQTGLVLLIGWLWLASGWTTTGACLLACRWSSSRAQG